MPFQHNKEQDRHQEPPYLSAAKRIWSKPSERKDYKKQSYKSAPFAGNYSKDARLPLRSEAGDNRQRDGFAKLSLLLIGCLVVGVVLYFIFAA
jgi:hypothetical protein